jgi:hypothetical protein
MSKELAMQETEWDLHENQQSFIPMEFTEEIKPDLFGLELTDAQAMTSGLATTFAEREILKNAYADVIGLEINTENLPIFKELRLKIVKNRTQGIEKWHKTNKAFYLAGGRFVDAVKNKEIVINEEMESKLLEAEKFFENQEKAKALALNEARKERLMPYVLDTLGLDFSQMSDYDFDDYLLGKKTRFENDEKERTAELIRIENERLVEIEKQRLAEIENEKIRVENARLQKEAEAKELSLQKERAEAKAAADKIEAENNAKLETQRKEIARIAKELQAKKDVELKAENERLAQIEADKKAATLAAKAPVKQQLSVWVESFSLPEIAIQNETSKEIKEKFEAFKKCSINKINNL